MLGLTVGASAQDVAKASDSSNESLRPLQNQRDQKVVKSGQKYFYFFKSGVSYNQALGDLTDCYRFLEWGGDWRPLPAMVLREVSPSTVEPGPPMVGGILGALIGPSIRNSQSRQVRNARLRRCMEPRGYVRYPLSETDWKWLVADFSPERLPLLARYASGPQPDAEPVMVNK